MEAHRVHVSTGQKEPAPPAWLQMSAQVDVQNAEKWLSAQAKAACFSLWSFPGGNGSIWAPKMPLAVKPRLLQTVGLGMEGLD